jgi:membrane-associated phospholipid phosphatase
MATYGAMAALVAAATPSWNRKVAAWAGAVLITAVVAISRLYLGVHWLTDVLGGIALGGLWLAVLLTTIRTVTGIYQPRTSEPAPVSPAPDPDSSTAGRDPDGVDGPQGTPMTSSPLM